MPYTYDFDPTGTLLANKITDEQHVLSIPTGDADFHFIIPHAAPFFAESVVVTLYPSGTVLTRGVDYDFSHYFLEASRATSKELYSSITIYDRQLSGTLAITYQTLGGEWAIDETQIADLLSNVVTNPRITTWEQIFQMPSQFPIIDHQWHLDDLVGASELIDAVDAITTAVDNATDQQNLMSFFYVPNSEVPANDAVGISLLPTLTGSDYYAMYDIGHQQREFEVTVAGDITFASPVYTAILTTNPLSTTVDVQLNDNTQYIWRYRDVNAEFTVGQWAGPFTFTTTDIYVDKPVAVAPLDTETDVEYDTALTASAYQILDSGGLGGYTDTHAESQFRIYDDQNNVIWDSGYVAATVTVTPPVGILLPGQVNYSWDVRYRATVYGWSLWSDRAYFVTKGAVKDLFALGTDVLYRFDKGIVDDLTYQQNTGVAADSFGSYMTDDGTSLFISSAVNGIKIVNRDTLIVSTVDPTGRTSHAITYGSDGYLYACCYNGSTYTIDKIDPVTLNTISSGQHGSNLGPSEFVIYGGGWVYAVEGASIFKYDPGNLSGGAGISFTAASGIANVIYGSDDMLYVADANGNINKVDPVTMASGSNYFNADPTTKGLALHTNGYLYGATASGNIREIDPATMTIVRDYVNSDLFNDFVVDSNDDYYTIDVTGILDKSQIADFAIVATNTINSNVTKLMLA